MAGMFYKVEIFQGILNWAKGNLTREEVNKLLLATDNERSRVFHFEAEFWKLELLQEISIPLKLI